MAPASFPQDVKLAAFHLALNPETIDLRGLRQILLQFRRKSHPERVPLRHCLVSVIGRGQFRIDRNFAGLVSFATSICQVGSQYGVMRRKRPESITAVLRLVKGDAAFL